LKNSDAADGPIAQSGMFPTFRLEKKGKSLAIADHETVGRSKSERRASLEVSTHR